MKPWYEAFTDHVIENWKKKGTVKDEEESRACLEAMMFLLAGYRTTCLISTLIDVCDLMEKFDEDHPEYNDEQTTDDELRPA